MNLEGKVSLVTGGTKGIGAATAIKLAAKGSDVAINGRNETEQAKSVKAKIEKMGRKCIIIKGDMGEPDDAVRAVEKTAAAFGGIDVLVHSAGEPVWGSIMDITPEAWYNGFDVHVHAVFHLSRTAVPYMKEKGEGAIVLISSVAGIRGLPNAIGYCVVKGAIPQLTRSLARELADDNIRVNCVSPGVILTEFHSSMKPEYKKNTLDNRIPLHRFGTAEQVAGVIELLVTNDYITGENYVIDAGLTMRIA